MRLLLLIILTFDSLNSLPQGQRYRCNDPLMLVFAFSVISSASLDENLSKSDVILREMPAFLFIFIPRCEILLFCQMMSHTGCGINVGPREINGPLLKC